MQTPKFTSALNNDNILSAEIIVSSNEGYFSRIFGSEIKDIYTAHISNIKIIVIINSYGSIFDPYHVVRFRAKKEEVGIIVNKIIHLAISN